MDLEPGESSLPNEAERAPACAGRRGGLRAQPRPAFGTPRALLVAFVLCALGACKDAAPSFRRVTLLPGPNSFGPGQRLWAPQPQRDKPLQLALGADGRKLYVTLQGSVDLPGHEVAVIDTATEQVVRRIAVGSSPTGIALHPGGRFLVVTNRFSNWASVIDTTTDSVVAEVPVPHYTIDVAFLPDGRRAYLTNRWKDSVLRWELEVGTSFRVTGDSYSGVAAELPVGIPVGQNPRGLAVSPDGSRLYVTSVAGLSLSIIDTASDRELRRVNLNSPAGGIAVSWPWLFVSHTGRGTHHPPDEGFDTDGDGLPGDGTANVMFQDLQNEIAVFDADGRPAHNYTTDNICCKDYRDVDPDDPTRGLRLPAPDSWPPSRVAYLPPKSTWVVACALPEQMAVSGRRLFAACSGSNEVQSFDVAEDGALTPRQVAGGLFSTGLNPFGLVVTPDGGRAYLAERLGEGVTVLELGAGPGHERRISVGDTTVAPFPATDAELGEAINFVTAPFTVDGRQTCVHCHREGGNVAKPVAMPLQADPVWGVRMTMAYRGAFDTRPWFFESAMDEKNFFPVINEFARKENFCCEQLDPLIWRNYPGPQACLGDPTLAGCNHVLDCVNNPPPECAQRRYGSPFLRRNDHFRAAAQKLFGRERTHGDALFEETAPGTENPGRRGILLDFDGVTRSLGLFLMQNPGLLPNPNAALALPSARRGQALYESPQTGCSFCHPLPVTTVTADFNPFGVRLRFPAVVTPRLSPDGRNVDGISPGFLSTFPTAEQDASGVLFGVPQLRGLWDRANLFLHDGRAPSLREALATPGHAALSPGQRGFNETFGMPDTHGATSQLSREELDDLVDFILSL